MVSNKEAIIRKVCTGLYFFLSGVEYAVILPTLNGFLLSMNSETVFLGITLASFSFSGLIVAPIYGRITDNTHSTKWCIIIGNFFEIIGNFLYFISSNKYMVWGSRLIAGAGSGAASSIFGTISRSTTTKERTAAFAQLMALRQIGLIIGPGFNVFLSKLDFYIGPFKLDQYTSPGFFMVILWTLHTLLIFIMYRDIATDPSPPDEQPISTNGQINSYEEIGKEDVGLPARAISLLTSTSKRSLFDEFFREEVIVCLTITFMLMFSQTGLETVVTPMTLLYFNWGGMENSILFCVAGAIVIVTFLSVIFLSKRVSDRALLLCGCLGMALTYAMFLIQTTVLYEFDDDEPSPPWLLPLFCLNVASLTISLPFAWVPQSSLFSKITSKETQAFNQGIRIVAMGLGQILGPIWASSMSSPSHTPIMIGIDLGLMIWLITMVIMSYNRLVTPPEPLDVLSDTQDIENDERTSLLGNGNVKHSVNA